MKTFLAQNQFISNSTLLTPRVDTAVAPSPGKGDATAGTIEVSDACEGNCSNADGSKTADGSIRETAVVDPGRAATAGLSHNPITQAVEVRDTIQSSCEPESPVEDNPWPYGESLQQGAGTSSKSSTAASVPHGKGSDAASVANPQSDPASAPHQSSGSQDHIAHLIHHAGQKHPDEDEVLYLLLKLHDKPGTRDLPEIPDAEALLNEIDPPFLHFLRSKMSAPQLPCDPVWADESPIFLRQA